MPRAVYLDTEAVAIADLDGDRDLDALFVFDGDGAVVARNDGSGDFTAVTVAGGARVTDGLAAGEVNRRGIRPPADDGLPNINPEDLLPEMFPDKE